MKLVRENTDQRALEHVRNFGPYETNKGKSFNASKARAFPRRIPEENQPRKFFGDTEGRVRPALFDTIPGI